MSELVTVEWRVPVAEWRVFVDHVENKYGESGRYRAWEVDSAMREYIREDASDTLSCRIDELIERAGGTPDHAESEKKNILTDPLKLGENETDTDADPEVGADLLGGETRKVRVKVDSDLKAQFAELADRSDQTCGECLAFALRARRNGGRDARLVRRIDAALDALDEHTDDASESESDDEPYADLPHTARTTRQIVDHLDQPDGARVAREQIHKSIEAVTGSDTDYMREQYTDRVVDHLELIPHTKNPDLFVDPDWMEQAALSRPDIPHPDAPAYDRLPPADLSREEITDAVKATVARARVKEDGEGNIGFGRRGMRVEELSQEAFNGELPESTVRTAAARAGNSDGWEWKETHAGTEILSINGAELSLHDPGFEAVTHDRWIERERESRREVESLTEEDAPPEPTG